MRPEGCNRRSGNHSPKSFGRQWFVCPHAHHMPFMQTSAASLGLRAMQRHNYLKSCVIKIFKKPNRRMFRQRKDKFKNNMPVGMKNIFTNKKAMQKMFFK
jgi:hypothetical protein